MRSKLLAWLGSLLIVAGLLVPAAAAIAAEERGTWSIVVDSFTWNTNGTTTVVYKLVGIPHPTSGLAPQALSHWDLGVCMPESQIVSAVPPYTEYKPGGDPSFDTISVTGPILKWNNTYPDGTSFTVTYQGHLVRGDQDWYTKSGSATGEQTGSVQGVTCATPTTTFTITKTVSTTNNPSTGAASVTLTGGGTVYYFYTITNTGNVPLDLVSAADDKIAGLNGADFGAGLLLPDATATASESKTFPDPPAATSETNTFTVTMAYNGSNLAPQTAQATVNNNPTPITPAPAFTITKTVSTSNNPSTGTASVTLTGGGTVYYFYTITNTGNVPLDIVSAADDKVSSLTAADFGTSPIPAGGGSVTATKSKTFPSPSSSTSEINKFTVTLAYNGTNLAPQEATATVNNDPPPLEPDPSFTIAKTVSTTNNPSTGSASVTLTGGGTVYYFYTITNTGNVPLTVASATDDKISSLAATDFGTSPLAADGGSVTVTKSKTFPAPTSATSETNTFTVTMAYGEDELDPQQASATVNNNPTPITPAPAFTITKTVSTINSPSTGSASVTLTGGGTVYYFYTITNTGNVPLTVASATDDKIASLAAADFGTSPLAADGGSVTVTKSKTFPSPSAATSETNTFTVTMAYGEDELDPQQATATVNNNPPGVTCVGSECDPVVALRLVMDGPPTLACGQTTAKFTAKVLNANTGQDTGLIPLFYGTGVSLDGTFTAGAPGTFTVTAKYGSLEASKQITVLTGTGASLSIDGPGLLVVGDSGHYTYVLTDACGNRIPGPPTWEVADQNGDWLCTEAGWVTVSASAGSLRATKRVQCIAGTVTVIVLDRSDGNKGVRDANVSLTGGRSGQTDSLGKITFNNLRFGTYAGTGSAPGRGYQPDNGQGETTITQASPHGTITIYLDKPQPVVTINLAPPTPVAPPAPPAPPPQPVVITPEPPKAAPEPLPKTGGPGWQYYMAGGLMVLAGLALRWRRKDD